MTRELPAKSRPIFDAISRAAFSFPPDGTALACEGIPVVKDRRLVSRLQEELGLLKISSDGRRPPAAKRIEEFLRALLGDAPAARAVDEASFETENLLTGGELVWERYRGRSFAAYLEEIRFVSQKSMGPRAPLNYFRGVLTIALEHFRAESPTALGKKSAALLLGAGLCVNVLRSPAARSSVQWRPLCLHATDSRGRCAARGDAVLESRIANAFWQTYWATDAIRRSRGATFPVAFFPISNESPRPPAGCSWAGARCLRRQIGRDHFLRGTRALFLDSLRTLALERRIAYDIPGQRFVLLDGAGGRLRGRPALSRAEQDWVICELNAAGFIDRYIGSNSLLKEEAYQVYTPEEPIVMERVVPYAGGSLLSTVFHEEAAARERGEVRGNPGRLLAGTNSLFFLNFPEEYSALHSAMNEPVALLVEEGQMLQWPLLKRGTLVGDRSGRTMIEMFSMARARIRIAGLKGELVHEEAKRGGREIPFALNPRRREPRQPACIFTAAWGAFQIGGRPRTPIAANRWWFVVVGDQVVEMRLGGAVELPPNGFAISLRKNLARGVVKALGSAKSCVRGTLTDEQGRPLRGGRAIRHALAVGPVLIKDGQILRQDFFADSTEGFWRMGEEFKAISAAPGERARGGAVGIPPTRFPHTVTQTRAPRTAIGVTESGETLLFVVDGRADLSHSVGATLGELAKLLKSFGAQSALNLDGGGSSVMFIAGEMGGRHRMREELSSGIVNLPSDKGGVERLLPVPLVYVEKMRS